MGQTLNATSSTGFPGTERRRLSVAHLVAASAQANPNAVALRDGAAEISYGELNARANKLARYLETLGVGPEVAIGICQERSFDQIVAWLGVLKAGGAFLPLDPGWPEERVRKLLDDAGAPVVVTGEAMADRLAAPGRKAIVSARDAHIIRAFGGAECSANVRRENLAYVIYTSGS